MEESRTFLDKQDATEVIKECYGEGKISMEDCKVLLDQLNLCPTVAIKEPEKKTRGSLFLGSRYLHHIIRGL